MPNANSLLDNSAIAGTYGDIDDKNDAPALKLLSTIGELKHKDPRLLMLQEDFKRICEMTLLDNEEYLYSLFLKSPAFTTVEFLCNYLVSLYSTKYAELIEKYPSIMPWLIFCIGICRSHNEANLKNLCCLDTVKQIRISQASPFKLVCKRRTPEDVSPEAKRAKMQSAQNPFYKNPIYVAHRVLFSIGRCANYCVPSEFAALFLNVTVGQVSKISSGNVKDVIKGFRGSLSRTIVCSLQSRETEYTCYRVAFVDNLLEIMTKLTGYPINFNQLNIGIKKNMMRRNLIGSNLDEVRIQGDSHLMPDKHYFCLMNNFQGTVSQTENPVLSLRTYSNIRYDIENEVFEPREDKTLHYEQVLELHREKLEAQYEAYENELNESLTNEQS